jgi:hypothetical protein
VATPRDSRGETPKGRQSEDSGMAPGWQTSEGVLGSLALGLARQARLCVGNTLEDPRSPELRTNPSGQFDGEGREAHERIGF